MMNSTWKCSEKIVVVCEITEILQLFNMEYESFR